MPSKNINHEDDYIPELEFEDDITRPAHYHKGGIDVISYLEQHFPQRKYTVAEGFFIGNIIKYVSRYKEKNGLDDLKKAEDYLLRLKDLEGEGTKCKER